MARIINEIEIEIEGQRAVALCDTGAVYSDVRETLVAKNPRGSVLRPRRVALGGPSIPIREVTVHGLGTGSFFGPFRAEKRACPLDAPRKLGQSP